MIELEDLENISQEDLDILNLSLDNALATAKTLFALLFGHGLHQTFQAPGIFWGSVANAQTKLIETDRCEEYLIEDSDRDLGFEALGFYQDRYG